MSNVAPGAIASILALPSYSVVVATYNYGRFLAEALDSALSQTHPALEIIVVDDGSTDETPEVLNRYAERIRVIRQSNQGQAAAWNAALCIARGDWVAFLDADDWWVPERVEQCLMAATEDVGVVMHDLSVVGAGSEAESWTKWTAVRIREGSMHEHTVPKGLPWCFTPTSAVIVRRHVLETIFPLDANRWRTCADAPVLHRAALRTKFRYLNRCLGAYRVHGSNSYHQQGWYDGDSQPRIVLENLWLLQRLAYEVNLDLQRNDGRRRVALWNHPYYSKMIGWVSGRRSWWTVLQTSWRRYTTDPAARRGIRAAASDALQLYRYQRRRDRAIGTELRRLAAAEYPGLDFRHVWAPDITRRN